MIATMPMVTCCFNYLTEKSLAEKQPIVSIFNDCDGKKWSKLYGVKFYDNGNIEGN